MPSADFSRAARRICEKLGLPKVSGLVGRSRVLIYKWTEPNSGLSPNLQQALKLDIAYINETKSAPPFLTAYSETLRAKSEVTTDNQPLVAEAVRLVNLATQVLEDLALVAGGPSAELSARFFANLKSIGEVQLGLQWSARNRRFDKANDK